MANIRPAGLSDEDSDYDEYGFYEPPRKPFNYIQNVNKKKTIEINLQDAIINGNLKEIQNIITFELNGNVNEKLDSGWTPLIHACFHAQDKIVEQLLNDGADPNIHSDSVTPIMVTCSNSNATDDAIENIVCKLVEKDCLLNVGDKYGQTPLMRAISSGRVGVVKILIDKKVNIEMRDQQGWTAIFWAIHHNRPEILDILISNGARLTEVDKNARKPIDIAYAHDYQDIIETLEKHLGKDKTEDKNRNVYLSDHEYSWKDYYPDLHKGHKITYSCEISHFLYGMNCERLAPIFDQNNIDLRTFLLMEEKDMIALGIDLPYERQRLKYGLREFHLYSWKLNSVAGLYARKMKTYSILDCLSVLGSHLQQLFILETSVTYILREYGKIQHQLKYEPPDSPTVEKLSTMAKKFLMHINSIRKEIKSMKSILAQVSSRNSPPADLISSATKIKKPLTGMTEFVVAFSMGVLFYHMRPMITNFIKK